jgi:hypothetical protein
MTICDATKTNGEPCAAKAVKGGTRCPFHVEGKVGAQPKLTPELADRLVSLLQAGNYITVAAREVGISRTLFYDWLARGESSERVDRLPRGRRACRAQATRRVSWARSSASVAG